MDALFPAAISAVRRGLRDALDRGAPDAVRLIEQTGRLDDARGQVLRETLDRYVQSVAAATPPVGAALKGGRP
jgi:F-type H+/Na+-transporting ATPase subunit alpha